MPLCAAYIEPKPSHRPRCAPNFGSPSTHRFTSQRRDAWCPSGLRRAPARYRTQPWLSQHERTQGVYTEMCTYVSLGARLSMMISRTNAA